MNQLNYDECRVILDKVNFKRRVIFMNISTHEIAAEILTLPEREQQEVFDFIEFLKVKVARQQSKRLLANQEIQANQQTEGEKMLQILETHGLLGCMEGDGNLSENYKQHLWGNE